MEQSVLVSVAVVTYNHKNFVRDCVESILMQDYTNIEIVIADDGSTDGTQEILKEYQAKYPGKFVLILSPKNQGITKNCNAAHFGCTGKYISWLGGDDLMLPGKLRKQVEYMEQHPECSICYHNLEVFDSETGKLLYLFNDKHKPFEGNVKYSIRHGTFNGACSNMLRRSKAPSYGNDERIPIASDWLYWVETLGNDGKIHFINETLGKYRRHGKNITETNILDNISDHLLSCAIIATKYPQYQQDILYRMSKLFRQFARFDKNRYYYFLLFSIRLKFNIKYTICIIIYFLTFKKVKL